MKINISEKTFAFIKSLAHELKTQDNRATANPRFYQIREMEKIVGFDLDYTDEREWISSDGIDCFTFKEALEFEKYDKPTKTSKQIIKAEEYLKHIGYSEVGIGYKTTYKNCFLTEKAINSHIEQNYYHYKNPTTYLEYAFRNPELEKVINLILEIDKEN